MDDIKPRARTAARNYIPAPRPANAYKSLAPSAANDAPPMPAPRHKRPRRFRPAPVDIAIGLVFITGAVLWMQRLHVPRHLPLPKPALKKQVY